MINFLNENRGIGTERKMSQKCAKTSSFGTNKKPALGLFGIGKNLSDKFFEKEPGIGMNGNVPKDVKNEQF